MEGCVTIAVAAPAGVGRRLFISRMGNVFTVSYFTEPGYVWTQVGQVTMALKPDILVGLAVTSHDRSVLTQAFFSTPRNQ